MGCLGSKQSLTESAGDFEDTYKQVMLLGRGSYGDVVQAEHIKTQKQYAVKKMKITDKNRAMVDFGACPAHGARDASAASRAPRLYVARHR